MGSRNFVTQWTFKRTYFRPELTTANRTHCSCKQCPIPSMLRGKTVPQPFLPSFYVILYVWFPLVTMVKMLRSELPVQPFLWMSSETLPSLAAEICWTLFHCSLRIKDRRLFSFIFYDLMTFVMEKLLFKSSGYRIFVTKYSNANQLTVESSTCVGGNYAEI